MAKRLRLRAGDVFTFEFDQERCGVGQVIEPGGVFLTTVLSQVYPKGFSLHQLDMTDILLTGWTMDSRLYHGFWHIVGNLPVPNDHIPRPCSVVMIQGEKWIQNYRAEPQRRATDREAELLDLHSSQSPMIYEDAFRARHGLGEWLPMYDKITHAYRSNHVRICAL